MLFIPTLLAMPWNLLDFTRNLKSSVYEGHSINSVPWRWLNILVLKLANLTYNKARLSIWGMGIRLECLKWVNICKCINNWFIYWSIYMCYMVIQATNWIHIWCIYLLSSLASVVSLIIKKHPHYIVQFYYKTYPFTSRTIESQRGTQRDFHESTIDGKNTRYHNTVTTITCNC